MADTLLDGIVDRDNSLTADLLRTFGSTVLTAGAHAVKGATLGLVDPTQEVARQLGPEITGAPPEWAKTGAEMVGEYAPISGALGAARKLVPGITAVPRFVQGALAGTGLGVTRGMIEGQEPTNIAKRSLLEGLAFGTLEGLTGIPASIRQRGAIPREIEYQTAKNQLSKALSVEEQSLAEQQGARPLVETIYADMGGTPGARLPAMQVDLSTNTFDELFNRIGKKLVFQTPEGEFQGILRAVGKKSIGIEADSGETIILKLKHLTENPARARIFVGDLAVNEIPRNWSWEQLAARKNYKKITRSLYQRGFVSKSEIDQLEQLIHPGAKGIDDFTPFQVTYLTEMMNRIEKNQPLPDWITEWVDVVGRDAADAHVGIWGYMTPARHAFEALYNKGAKYAMTDFFEPFAKAVTDMNHQRVVLADKVRQWIHGFSKAQRQWIYQMDKEIADKLGGLDRTDPAYITGRQNIINKFVADAENKWGPEAATRIQDAHQKFRALFDAMHDDLANMGLLKRARYIKDYWPLLREERVFKEMYPNAPGEKIQQFMQFIRKNVIDNPETDIIALMRAYIMGYTKLKHLKPQLTNMYKIFEDRHVPKDIREFMQLYASRQMGIPSVVDFKLAETLRTAGKNLPIFGKYFKDFTTLDFERASMWMNNLPYLAHLGFRPFAALRNMLQMFITTGPMIGNRWLARGLWRTFNDPEMRKWVVDNKMLQASLGEFEKLYHIDSNLKDKFAQWSMWMFQKTDEVNRFASALGMREKFDHYFSKLGATEELWTKLKLRRFRDSVREEVRNLGKAWRAADELEVHQYPKDSPRAIELGNVIKKHTGRDYMPTKDIEEQIRRKLTVEAVGDTQWLYGKEHAPLFTYRMGFFGRQAGLYQTWWLNYANFLKRLVTTARGGDKAPLATFFANNMLLGMAALMAGWELSKVAKTVGLGPFPSELPFIGQPAPGIEPIYRASSAILHAFSGDIEGTEKRLQTAFRKAWDNWVPGSLLYKELAKVGWTPQMEFLGTKLTPEPKELYAKTAAKLARIGAGYGSD